MTLCRPPHQLWLPRALRSWLRQHSKLRPCLVGSSSTSFAAIWDLLGLRPPPFFIAFPWSKKSFRVFKSTLIFFYHRWIIFDIKLVFNHGGIISWLNLACRSLQLPSSDCSAFVRTCSWEGVWHMSICCHFPLCSEWTILSLLEVGPSGKSGVSLGTRQQGPRGTLSPVCFLVVFIVV